MAFPTAYDKLRPREKKELFTSSMRKLAVRHKVSVSTISAWRRKAKKEFNNVAESREVVEKMKELYREIQPTFVCSSCKGNNIRLVFHPTKPMRANCIDCWGNSRNKDRVPPSEAL